MFTFSKLIGSIFFIPCISLYFYAIILRKIKKCSVWQVLKIKAQKDAFHVPHT